MGIIINLEMYHIDNWIYTYIVLQNSKCLCFISSGYNKNDSGFSKGQSYKKKKRKQRNLPLEIYSKFHLKLYGIKLNYS